MSHRAHWLRLTLIAAGLTLGNWPSSTNAQTSGMSATLVLRTQAASIADEASARLKSSLSSRDQIRIVVEGGTARTVVENAFLDLFGRLGLHGYLAGAQGTSRVTLQVTVLDQSVRYSGLSSGEYRREVQTSIEGRSYFRDSTATEYLGIFKRQDVDTVAFREEIGTASPLVESERSLFDRLAGPLILIAGAFLVVYLFFTVRN